MSKFFAIIGVISIYAFTISNHEIEPQKIVINCKNGGVNGFNITNALIDSTNGLYKFYFEGNGYEKLDVNFYFSQNQKIINMIKSSLEIINIKPINDTLLKFDNYRLRLISKDIYNYSININKNK